MNNIIYIISLFDILIVIMTRPGAVINRQKCAAMGMEIDTASQ
jgi:hypothetical protein